MDFETLSNVTSKETNRNDTTPNDITLNDATLNDMQATLETASLDPEKHLLDPKVQKYIVTCLRLLECGKLRVASPAHLTASCGPVPMDNDLETWQIHTWVKQCILLAMRWRTARSVTLPPANTLNTAHPTSPPPQGRDHMGYIGYCDKFDMRDLSQHSVRVVPPGVVREGAYVGPKCIVMPGYVNIGAWVGEGTLVDTWATVGSCAQIGKNVHLSGGVGIGGVLEPAQARPVMVGDNAFIGSRAIVVEGAVVSRGAVLGANVCLTRSTPLYDVTTSERKEYRGYVPPYAVVAPGTRLKSFPGGDVHLQCAYIISYRSQKTESKVSLNHVLRETGLDV
jgi:2,3,4,5-tetrahydropyridine-2,6-dicarboxylate N-succinyltransferase